MKRRPIAERLAEKTLPEPNSGCWLFDGALHRDGHGAIGGETGARRQMLKAHRVAYELAVGPIPEGQVVCHRCDVPACVNPAHLFLGYPRDNALDMWAKGRGCAGEKNGQAKLTIEQVQRIRAMHAEATAQGPRKWSSKQVAAEYGLSEEAVRLLVTGGTWKRALAMAGAPLDGSRGVLRGHGDAMLSTVAEVTR